MKTFSSGDILDRLKTALSIRSDKELAEAMGVTKAALSNWRTRNSLDFSALFSICEPLNIDWVIYGRGEQTLEPNEALPTAQGAVMERLLSQAEEIGRLKARVEQLEEELQKVGSSADDATSTHAALA